MQKGIRRCSTIIQTISLNWLVAACLRLGPVRDIPSYWNLLFNIVLGALFMFLLDIKYLPIIPDFSISLFKDYMKAVFLRPRPDWLPSPLSTEISLLNETGQPRPLNAIIKPLNVFHQFPHHTNPTIHCIRDHWLPSLYWTNAPNTALHGLPFFLHIAQLKRAMPLCYVIVRRHDGASFLQTW